MSGYVLKPADADVAHEIDWSIGHLADGEKISADLGWSVLPVLGGSEDLRITEQRHDRRTSRAVFSGGVPGRFYLISNRVRTFDDRVLARSIVMRIAARKAARQGDFDGFDRNERAAPGGDAGPGFRRASASGQRFRG